MNTFSKQTSFWRISEKFFIHSSLLLRASRAPRSANRVRTTHASAAPPALAAHRGSSATCPKTTFVCFIEPPTLSSEMEHARAYDVLSGLAPPVAVLELPPQHGAALSLRGV